MPCFRPLKGWYSRVRNEDTGKRSVVFKRSEGLYDRPVTVPCGKCIGCKLEFSRQWAMRCVHESQLYDNNCFLTLTYDDGNIPKGGTLVKSHFQKFMKRLRKFVNKQYPGKRIKYLHCGEYGSESGRPHYHAIIFNYDFEDKKPCLELSDTNHYSSESLEKLWPYGFSLIGEVNFNTCAYVAGYCVKGALTQEVEEMYDDDVYKGRVKPYLTMSRGRKDEDGRSTAIGAGWYYKFGGTDCYDFDEVVIRDGLKCKPPKFYDSLLDLTNPSLLGKIKRERVKNNKDNPHNYITRNCGKF